MIVWYGMLLLETMMKPHFETTGRIVVIGIVLVGFYLRVVNVFDQTPVNIDDMYYTSWPRDMVSAHNFFPMQHKPLWQLMVAVGYVFLGNHLFVAPLLSVFFGTLTIATLYRLGCRLFGETNALYAAALSASLLTYIHLSRWSQAQMTAMFFLLAATALYEEGLLDRRHRLIYLLLAGLFAGTTLVVYPLYVAICILLVFWEVLVIAAKWRQSGGIRLYMFTRLSILTGGMAMVLILPEIVTRWARAAGVARDSWIGGIYLDLWMGSAGAPFEGWEQRLLAGGPDFLRYWRILEAYEGSIVPFALVLSTGFMAIRAWRCRKGSLWRALGLLLLPIALLHGALIFQGPGIGGKYIAILLPGIPLVLAYLIGNVSGAIVFSLGNSTHTPLVFSLLLCTIVSGWGYWHAKSRIEWSTGHNAAYVAVQDFGPERIYYSTDNFGIWRFYFGGLSNAFPFSEDELEILSGGSDRDVLVVSNSGVCSKGSQPPMDVLAGLQTSRLRPIATFPAFDYTRSHDIDWAIPSLSGGFCHYVYTFQG